MNTKTITMTVYAIEAQQVETTQYGEPPGSRYLNGRISVKARGQGHDHEWILQGPGRYWPGDTVQVVVIEADPPPADWGSPTSDVPKIDLR